MTVSTSQLQIVTQLDGDQYSITGTILTGGFLPQEIFLYENTGTTELGPYQGVADTTELTRFQVFSGTAIPKFGNAFVRSSSAKIILNVQQDATSVIQHLTNSVTNLSAALKLAASSTQVITIT
jgi:hypothetical protein